MHELAHRNREFFDWGGWLAVRPMDELPYWRVLMRRGIGHGSSGAIFRENSQVVEEMRAALKSGARLSSRDLEATGTETGKTYRGSKVRALALYYLWRTGEAMTWERRGFERVYAAAEAVAPPELLREVDEREAELFLARKEVAAQGIGRLPTPGWLSLTFGRKFTKADREALERDLVERGDLAPVAVEGWRTPQLVLTADVPLLDAVGSGAVPEPWRVDGEAHASFLSPLDPVVARGRAMELFGFEHIWEIYKRPAEVKYGRFTMPVLVGDRLVGRMDAKLDRASSALVLNGFWFEDEADPALKDHLDAVVAEFERLLAFLGADKLVTDGAVGSAQAADGLARHFG